MNTRKMQAKMIAKKTALKLGDFLLAGGTATNLYIMIAPGVSHRRTCENALQGLDEHSTLDIFKATVITDMGVYIFLTAGIIRTIFIPLNYWTFKQLYACWTGNSENQPISKECMNFMRKFEKTIVNCLNTLSFMQTIPSGNNVFNNFISIFCTFPLIHFTTKRFKEKFFNSYNPAERFLSNNVREKCNKVLPSLAKGLKKLGIISSVASTSRSISEWCINWFYNSTHKRNEKWEGEDDTLISILMTTAMLALALIYCFPSKANALLNQFTFLAGSFITITNIIASIYMCTNIPAYLDTDNFWRNNLSAFILICVAGGIATYFNRLQLQPTETEMNAPTSRQTSYGSLNTAPSQLGLFSSESESEDQGFSRRIENVNNRRQPILLPNEEPGQYSPNSPTESDDDDVPILSTRQNESIQNDRLSTLGRNTPR